METQKLPQVLRSPILAEKVVIVDGLFGCGKTMLSPIVGALDRVELLTYAYELECLCALHVLGHITQEAAVTMVRMFTDLQLYNTMMSREVNFRPSDLSSVFKSATPGRYIRRLFQAGDEAVPRRIKQQRPLLLLTTHNLLHTSTPVFAALGQRVVLLEVVRHPLYMVKQQSLNVTSLWGADVRDFTVYIKHEGQQIPFFVHGWEDRYRKANAVERAILYMQELSKRTREARELLRLKYQAQIITIVFERFVLDPEPYLKQITDTLGTTVTSTTKRMMKKQRVPRKRYADGLKLRIYERCGWEPPKQGSIEADEFARRREFAAATASPEALALLDLLAREYEAEFLSQR